MKTISVIGSCVCRDLFEKDTENFSFHTDVRFSSPISMLASPVEGVVASFDSFKKNVPTVNGKWYKKNLINDINKTAFSALQERHGDYLILDFAESRISIADISLNNKKNHLLVSNSVSFRAHYNASFKKGLLKNSKITTINPLDYDDNSRKQIIHNFKENILKIFKEENIILIKNMPAKYYVDRYGCLKPYYSKDHFESICCCEILLPKLYDMWIQECPKCKVIEIPEHALGSQTHKWGNHPFHFTEEYYDYLLDCVKSIILDNNVGKTKALFNNYETIFKKRYLNALNKTAKYIPNSNDFTSLDLLKEYEEFNSLGRKQKLLISFAIDKKHCLKNFKRIKKGE